MYSNEFICNVLLFINENINYKIDIDTLAKVNYINRYYLMKLFKKEMGITINNYINNMRIYNSLSTLRDNSILKTALNNGFYSQEYYSEIFKKIMGVSPIMYKKYVNHFNNISFKNVNILLNNLINLKELVDKKDKYLNNRKPSTNFSVLSIYRR